MKIVMMKWNAVNFLCYKRRIVRCGWPVRGILLENILNWKEGGDTLYSAGNIRMVIFDVYFIVKNIYWVSELMNFKL